MKIKNVFNTRLYQGKNRIYSKVEKGISKCWQWNESIKEYRFQYFEGRKKGLLKKEDKKTFQDLKAAKNWLFGIVDQIVVTDNSPLFSVIFEKWKNEHFINLRVGTQIGYKNRFHLLNSLLNIPIRSINPDVIDSWVMNLKNRPMRSTRIDFKKEISFLRCIFSFYKEHDSASFDIPIRKRHISKSRIKESPLVNKAILESDFIRFRNQLLTRPNGDIFGTLATVQFYHSLRIGEAAGLHRNDICFNAHDIRGNTIRIQRSVKWDRIMNSVPRIENNFKNSVAVGIKSSVLHPEAKCFLEKLMPNRDSEVIFTIGGKLLTYKEIAYEYNLALKKLNLQFSGTHFLRAGSATMYYNAHGNAALVQSQLGVTNMSTAQVYAKVLNSKVDDYYEGLYKKVGV